MRTTTEKRQQFESLVTRAEQEITTAPKAYRRRLKLIAYLGYSVIFLLVAALLAIIGGTAWAALASSALFLLLIKKKLIIVLAGLVWVIGRSLFIKIEAPEGYELSREEFSRLWAEIDRLTAATGAPKVHRVIMTPEMNAAMAQTPRFGIIGPYKNTLIIGLELMIVLSEEQLRSVLAHELAHLSGSHSKFSSWIYRLRATWSNIHEAFHHQEAWGTGMVRRFVSWYEPYFSGYSYVLARDNEYEADALAASVTSPDSTASALVAVYSCGDVINEGFWQPLYDKAYVQEVPDDGVYSKLQQFYGNSDKSASEYQRALQLSLKRKPHPTDTHPSLSQRLAVLKCPDVRFKSAGHSSIQWLGAQTDDVFNYFDAMWSYDNRERWEHFHNAALRARQQISEYANRDYAELDADEKWHYADLSERYLPDNDALPLFLRYKAAHPDDPDGDLVIGRLLLERNDPKGISFVKKSVSQPHLRIHAAKEAWSYYSRNDNEPAAGEWLLEYELARDVLEEAQAERDVITPLDPLVKPELTEEEQLDLLGDLHHDAKVKEVWVAQKKVKHFKNKPVYIVAVKCGGFIYNKEAWFDKLAADFTTEKDVFLTSSVISSPLAKAVMKNGLRLD